MARKSNAKGPETAQPPPAPVKMQEPAETTEDLHAEIVQLPPSIGMLMQQLGNRIGSVMSETRKRPGDFVALQAALQTCEESMKDHPLYHYRGANTDATA